MTLLVTTRVETDNFVWERDSKGWLRINKNDHDGQSYGIFAGESIAELLDSIVSDRSSPSAR